MRVFFIFILLGERMVDQPEHRIHISAPEGDQIRGVLIDRPAVGKRSAQRRYGKIACPRRSLPRCRPISSTLLTRLPNLEGNTPLVSSTRSRASVLKALNIPNRCHGL